MRGQQVPDEIDAEAAAANPRLSRDLLFAHMGIADFFVQAFQEGEDFLPFLIHLAFLFRDLPFAAGAVD